MKDMVIRLMLLLASRRALCVLLALCLLSHDAIAGKLGDFESDATKKSKGERTPSSSSDHDDDGLDELVLAIILAPLIPITWLARDGVSEATRLAASREAADPILPGARLDVVYQDVDSDVDAFAYSIELGQGPLGAEFRQTHYREDEPSGTLDIFQLHGLCRMCALEELEVDLALGAVRIEGDESNTGFSFGFPMRYWPDENIGVEFRPAWGSIHGTWTRDYDLSALVRYEHTSLRLGYRWMESPEESLNGPYVGLSFRY